MTRKHPKRNYRKIKRCQCCCCCITGEKEHSFMIHHWKKILTKGNNHIKCSTYYVAPDGHLFFSLQDVRKYYEALNKSRLDGLLLLLNELNPQIAINVNDLLDEIDNDVSHGQTDKINNTIYGGQVEEKDNNAIHDGQVDEMNKDAVLSQLDKMNNDNVLGQVGERSNGAGLGQVEEMNNDVVFSQPDEMNNNTVLGQVEEMNNDALLGQVKEMNNDAVLGQLDEINNNAVLGQLDKIKNDAVLGQLDKIKNDAVLGQLDEINNDAVLGQLDKISNGTVYGEINEIDNNVIHGHVDEINNDTVHGLVNKMIKNATNDQLEGIVKDAINNKLIEVKREAIYNQLNEINNDVFEGLNEMKEADTNGQLDKIVKDDIESQFNQIKNDVEIPIDMPSCNDLKQINVGEDENNGCVKLNDINYKVNGFIAIRFTDQETEHENSPVRAEHSGDVKNSKLKVEDEVLTQQPAQDSKGNVTPSRKRKKRSVVTSPFFESKSPTDVPVVTKEMVMKECRVEIVPIRRKVAKVQSSYFNVKLSNDLPGSCKVRSGSRGLHQTIKYTPPPSPYKLIQERLYHSPWQLLLSTIFLNVTTHQVAFPIFEEFLKRYDTPEVVVKADWREIADLLKPMGLHEKRAKYIIRFSDEYLNKDWNYPIDLFGIGKYGDDSYRIFCLGQWKNVQPQDHKLNLYHEWIVEQHRMGLL